MPGGQVHGVELCFDNLSDVVEHTFLLESKGDAVDCVLLHLLRHVTLLHNCVVSIFLANVTVRLHNVLVVVLGLPQLGSCNSFLFVGLSSTHF